MSERDGAPAAWGWYKRSHPHDTSGGREGIAEGSACAMIITMTDPDIERGRPDEAAVSRSADRDGRRPGRRFGRLGMLAGACAALPVLLGPNLNVAHQVEIADHLIPAVVVLAVSAMVLAMNRTAPVSGVVVLASGLVVALAGLWMVATHLPLVAQGARHQAPWAATTYHTGSAVLVLALGLVWTGASLAEVA